MVTDLLVQVHFYPTSSGGKTRPALSGYSPIATTERKPQSGFNGWSLRVCTDVPILPGDTVRATLKFLTPEGRSHMLAARKFYLWEGRTVAEATVVE
jgi:hypothetical protein